MAPQWSLVLFTFFFCMAGGTLAMQGLLTLTGRGRKVQLPMLATSAIALVAGMAALCTRFQHIERLFNAFGSVTSGSGVSGLTLVLWLGMACLVTVVLYAVLTHRSDDDAAPRWCGGVAAAVGLALAVLLGGAYKTTTIPAGIVPLLDAYYLFDALLMGGLVALVAARLCKDDSAADLAVKVGLVGGVGTLASVLFYGFAIGSFEQAGGTVRYANWSSATVVTASVAESASGLGASFAIGPQAPMFWGIAVAVGLLVPLAALFALRVLGKRAKDAPVEGRPKSMRLGLALGAIALICVIAGSIVWRCLL